MSLLPQSASFHELVQDCFLAFRGTGLMLSPLDVELIDGWAEEGVPLEVVVRGIRRAAEAALFDTPVGAPPMRSLRACRKAVAAEFKKHRGSSAGKGQQAAPEPLPSHLKRHHSVLAVLRKVAREQPEVAAAVEGLMKGLFAEPPSDLTQGAAREEAAEVALVRALSYPNRLALLREARQMAQEAGSLSWRARKIARRFHRAALLRRRLNLPPYW